MGNYDVIVIGGGLTGSALSYELVKKGLQVLLLEKDELIQNATLYSYGGIAYWCGNDDLTSKLSQEAIEIHRNLSQELGANTEFQELDLLFTIDQGQNPEEVKNNYQQFHIQPELLDLNHSLELEPLLNKETIVGSLRFPQGHVHPQKTILAYQKAFQKLGGEIAYEQVNKIEQKQAKVTGIQTNKNNYSAPEIIISAGAYSRSLLQSLNLELPIYFSHAQLIKTPPSSIKLSTLVMPATTKRLEIEKQITAMEKESPWENPTDEIQADVLEAGAIQFADGSYCLGQISQIITNIHSPIDNHVSEARIREALSQTLPTLSSLPGKLHNCQIAFSHQTPFQVGRIDSYPGLSIFSGFTSPFVFVPPLAKYFAHYIAEGNEETIDSLPDLKTKKY